MQISQMSGHLAGQHLEIWNIICHISQAQWLTALQISRNNIKEVPRRSESVFQQSKTISRVRQALLQQVNRY